MYKDLVIIDNEKITLENNIFYCDNFEAKISEDFNKFFDTTLIARKSKIKRATQINLNKIHIASNIFLFLFNIFKTFKKKNTTYLIVAINPYTFLSYLFLFFFRKKIFVYLRSDGHEEYKAILGFFGPAIYYVMFKIVTFKSQIITCQERLFTKRKSYIVFPSTLDSFWFDNLHQPMLDKAKLLYVGRIKVEKGIFSLLKIFDEVKDNVQLTIVGRTENLKSNNKKVNFLKHTHDPKELIKIYDNHNIFILPSFTEAHPKVVDEALARMRPIIIFEDINHIIKNKKGIYVSKRNTKSLLETISYIMKNYKSIQENMAKNELPTKKEFILKMSEILSSN